MSKLIPFSKRSAFMRPVFDEFDVLFNKVFGEPFFLESHSRTSFPKFNIYDKNGNFVVEALVGDTPKDKIDVTLEDNILTVKGESNQNQELKEDNYYVREISRRSFVRSLKIPEIIKNKTPKTSLEDGVLKIVFEYPKDKEAKKEVKKIEIN